jgi:HD domain
MELMTAGTSAEAGAEPFGARVPALVRGSGYRALVIDRLVRQAAELTGAAEACLLVHYPQPPSGTVAAVYGLSADVIASAVELEEGRPALIRDAACADVVSGDFPCGRLEVGVEPPLDRHAGLLARQAALIGRALDGLRMPASLAESIQAEAETLAASMDEKAGHGVPKEAQIDLARALAARLQLSRVDAVELELAIRLAEAGMIAVDDEDASASVSASADEAVAVSGAETLADVPGLQAVAAIVRHGAERWDGGGGPEGLAGDRIPIASRVLRACSLMRAIRPPSIEDLRGAAGAELDPRVADALVAVLDGGDVRSLRIS